MTELLRNKGVEKMSKWMGRKLWKWLHLMELENKIYHNTKRIVEMEKLVTVGIDIHCKSDSWAVLCIAGKPEFVQFRRLESKDARYLLELLRNMERRYGYFISDIPPMAREYFNFNQSLNH